MSIHIYKPSKSNSGFAAQFYYSDREDCAFAQLIKQHSWNPETRTGSFKESLNDPTKKVTIKLEFAEIGAILDCLDRNRPLNTVHNDGKGTKTIGFTPWLDNAATPPTLKGYSFAVTINNKEDSANNNKFYIGITLAEGRLLREFLIWLLNRHFDKDANNYKNNQTNFQQAKSAASNFSQAGLPKEPDQLKAVVEKIAEKPPESVEDPLVDF